MFPLRISPRSLLGVALVVTLLVAFIDAAWCQAHHLEDAPPAAARVAEAPGLAWSTPLLAEPSDHPHPEDCRCHLFEVAPDSQRSSAADPSAALAWCPCESRPSLTRPSALSVRQARVAKIATLPPPDLLKVLATRLI